jgi:Ca-activated chloride channel homolog
MSLKLTGLLLVLLFVFGLAGPAQADGIIIPPPLPCRGTDCPPVPPRPVSQLVIRYHHVNVTIQDQLAVTRVDQVFYNPNDWPVEGTYVFPLPLDAAVSNFTLWVDGKPFRRRCE